MSGLFSRLEKRIVKMPVNNHVIPQEADVDVVCLFSIRIVGSQNSFSNQPFGCIPTSPSKKDHENRISRHVAG